MDSLQKTALLHMLRLTGVVAVSLFYASFLCGAELSPAEIELLLEKAEKKGQQMSLPANKHTEQGKKAAQETFQLYQSKAFQRKVEGYKEKLQSEVFNLSKKRQEAKSEENSPLDHEPLYIFISQSVPEETIRRWIQVVKEIGSDQITVVMRGVPGGLNKTDNEWFERIYRVDKKCNPFKERCEHIKADIAINPYYFNKFEITAVPAVAIETAAANYVVYGDASLDYLIEQINKEAKSEKLAALVERMRQER